MDASKRKPADKNARREANRRSYEKSKQRHDSVLMRLERGDAALLDAGSGTLGLSRSAFIRMFLAPTLGVVASHIPAIETARSERGQSFAQFLAASIRTSISAAPAEPNPPRPADEFDLLFGPAGEEP